MKGAVIKLICYFLLSIQFIGLPIAAQDEIQGVTPIDNTWEKNLLKTSVPIFEYKPHPFIMVRKWKWEELGPNEIPEEPVNPNTAVPAYSFNRGNGTGRINYLYLHPTDKNKLWACSPTGGLWFTKNGGYKWISAGTDKLPVSGVSSVAVNLKRPKQWIISTGDGDDQFMPSNGIWRTLNGGKTYECLNGADPSTALPIEVRFHSDANSFIGEVVCSPTNFSKLYVAASNGLWVCDDASKKSSIKWKRVWEGNFYDIQYIERKRPESDIIACAGDRLIISFDGGATWEEMPSPTYPKPERYPFLRMSLQYSKSLPNFLYVAVTSSERATQSSQGEGVLQLFDLRTRSWQFVRSFSEGIGNVIPTRARAFTVSPVDPKTVFCGNVMPIYKSTDGGYQFQRVGLNQLHDDTHHIQFSADGKHLWASHDGGVSYSKDGGVTWKSRDKGIGAANVFGVSVGQTRSPVVAFGGYDVGGNLLRNGKWHHANWGDGFETVVHPQNSDIVITTMQNGLLFRSDDGLNFSQTTVPNTKSEWHTWIRLHPAKDSTLFCSGKRLARSNDLGLTWQYILDVAKLDSAMHSVYKFYLSEKNPNVMYVYLLDKATNMNPKLYRTKNLLAASPQDVVWEPVKALPEKGWLASVCPLTENPDQFWLLHNSIESTNKVWFFDGVDYQDHSNLFEFARCETMILDENTDRIYLGSNRGIFTKALKDNKWELLTGLPGTFVKSLAINRTANKLVVGTFGRGVWQGDLYNR